MKAGISGDVVVTDDMSCTVLSTNTQYRTLTANSGPACTGGSVA